MMVIKIEVHPGGDSTRARTIGELFVANVSQLAEESNYVYAFDIDELRELAHSDSPLIQTVSHRRSDGPWVLARRILNDIEAS